MIDGAPIIALLTGIETTSQNAKTGPMLQTWILVKDSKPTDAIKNKSDHAVCGDCPLRGDVCYVNAAFAPNNLYRCYVEGNYKVDNPKKLGRNQRIRLGAYGDPAAVPVQIWADLLQYADNWTGYTHSPDIEPRLKRYVQASCETQAQAERLQADGWKTYRIKPENEPVRRGEILCPSDKGVTCFTCLKCNGQEANIAINIHGTKHKIRNFHETYNLELQLPNPI
jgi:transcription elongation factor Elf1